MQIELKPCPFCGGSDFLKVEPYQFPPDEEGDAWQWGYNVVCDASGFEGSPKGCGASSPWQETPDEAVVSWNRRAEAATPPDVAGLIDSALRELDNVTAVTDQDSNCIGCAENLLRQAATALRLSAGGGWRTIESVPTDDTLFLAYCPPDYDFPDGRMMIWRGSIFAFQKKSTPRHLRFPATHWQPLPLPPASPTVEAGR